MFCKSIQELFTSSPAQRTVPVPRSNMWNSCRSRAFLAGLFFLLPYLSLGMNLEFSVPHTAKEGHAVGSLDHSGSRHMSCSLDKLKGPSSDASRYFNVTSLGHIYTVSSVSSLVDQHVGILVKCGSGIESGIESSSYSSQHAVTLHIDNGHSSLFFPVANYEGNIQENLPANSVAEGLENLFATTETFSHKSIDYSIISGARHVFKLVKHRGGILSVVTIRPLDRERTPFHVFQIKACLHPCWSSAISNVTIHVGDVNDNIPYFEKSDFYTTISQSIPSLSTVYFVEAIDLDIDTITYSAEPSNIFSIDPSRGHVILNQGMMLKSPYYSILIQATDSSGQKSKTARLHIRVDVVLRFRPHSILQRSKRNVHPAKEVEIPESYIGILVRIHKSASDRFRFKEPSPEMLEINRVTGTVSLKSGYKLDYETKPIIEFTVVITKMNDQSYRQEEKVRIKLSDENDELPFFVNQPRPFLATVSQNAGPGTSVYHLIARDPDQDSEVHYNLESGGEDRFEVDGHSGVVRTKGTQPFSWGKEYEIGVSVSDVNAGRAQNSPTHSLKILVGEREPQFCELMYQAKVSEAAEQQKEIVNIKAYSFQGFPITYELTTEAGQPQNDFAIDSKSGVVDLLRTLDYESDTNEYHLMVKARENGQVQRTSTVNLRVKLVDENDNSPMFPLSQYIVTLIPETVAMGTDIIRVMATDLDSVTNAQLTYTVSDNNFTVQSFNNMGYIKTARRLDYDYIPDHTYNFTVTATDNGTPARNGMATVRVGVTNINDESPVFPQSIEHIQVSEDAHNTVVHVVQAYDPDGDGVTYSFTGGAYDEGPFHIDSQSGIITLRGYMNRDVISYKLNITAKDDGKCCGGTQRRESRGQVIIEVKDINNNAPVFPECSEYHPEVDELQSVGTPVIRVRAIDPDRGANGNISYSVVKSGDQSSEWFAIDAVTGQVRSADVFDRESKTGVTDLGLTIKAEDQGSPRLAGFCTFTVKIGDVNDNPPVFDLPSYSVTIDESTIIGKKVLQVYATDRDAGENGQVEYSIAHDPSNGFFRIESNTGWIKVARAMSGHNEVRLRVRSQDRGVPPKLTGVDVIISIQKQMNSFPQWQEDYSSRTIHLSENAPRDFVVKRLKAFSENVNSPYVNYVIQAGETADQNGPPESFHSRIDEETNEMILMVYKSLDYEVINTYTLNIKAANRATNSIHNDTRITIKLNDENDEIPMFVGLDENGRYSGSVPENSPEGTVVIRATATDRDARPEYSRITYHLNTIYDYEKFEVDPLTGQITTTARFDREVKSEYYIMVVAHDGAKSDRPNHSPLGTPNQGEVEVQIRVTDKNDERPYFKQFLYTASVPENADPGSVIITVTAEDMDEENTLSYSIPHGNVGNVFEVDSALGQIRVRGELDYEQGPKEYRLQYRVFDEKFDNTTTVIIHVLDVNDNPPRFQRNVYNFSDLVEEESGISPANRKYLLTVRAIDPDTDRDSNIRYSLTGQFHADGTFSIDPYTGAIYLNRPLDRDEPKGRAVWNFNILAHDEPGTDSSLTGYAEVRIMPHDINDNAPVFNRNFLVGKIKEHSLEDVFYDSFHLLGNPVLTVMAEDKDAGKNGTVTYSLKQSPTKDGKPLFTIDRDSGLISTMMSNTLDREVKAMYDDIIVQAKDKGSPPYQQSASATVTIMVEDINDHAPQFTQKVYKATMSEDLALDTSVTSVSATDRDIGVNAKLTYTLKEDDRSYFSMMSVKATNTGVLKVFKKPDFDSLLSPTFNLTVYVTDTDSTHIDVAYIEVNVTDANDNAPMFMPTNQPVTVFENVSMSTSLARFKARDIDTGINGQFSFSIDRNSDPEQLYSINSGGVVTVAKQLDREAERGPTHRVRILAVDKGFPPQTGVGTLMVTLLDVNDNYPKFKYDYRPVIYENQGVGISVVTIHAVDDDTLANGPPFTFSTPHCSRCPCTKNPSCHAFEFIFRPESGPNRYGEGEVRSKMTFDREQQKEYYLPIIMKDNGNPPQSGTNTLTIVIGDINDNLHFPGHKDVFVYNYKGDFENIYLGRVFAEDKDDWDLEDKDFSFVSQDSEKLFRLDGDTGELFTRGKIATGDFTFSVQVEDKHWNKKVASTVTVHVQEIGDDAVYSSGSMRLTGVTAEEFVELETSHTKPKSYHKSTYDRFREKLARKLDIPTSNVDIFTVMNHATLPRTVDIRFTAHNSPYYKPVRMDGLISANLDEFSRELGIQITMVPIDECLKEECEGGCSNTLVTTGDPMVVNTNGSSLIGVTAYIKAECVCAAREFSENVTTCEHPYSCLNGGRCHQREHDFVCSCRDGFAGPRCQQTHRSFKGNGWAWFKPLAQCEQSHTSLEFMTTSADGLLFYNGPIRALSSDTPKDFILLELRHGYPVLHINHGAGEARLSLDGRDIKGLRQVDPLNDGRWHRVDVFRNGKEVKLIVDKCRKSQIVENENAQTSYEDRRPCEVSGDTPGVNKFINVNTPLQLGGLASRDMPYPDNSNRRSFKGCIRNFMHDGELYDLHIGNTGQQSNSEDGCSAEEHKCGWNSVKGPVCGKNSICEANLNDDNVLCTCKPGYRGPKCSIPTTVKDFHTDSFIEWDFKDNFYEDRVDYFRHMTDLQLMFRTRETRGMLFITQNTHKSEYMVMEVENMRVQFRYNLGSGEQLLQLAYVNVSEGNWHTVTMSRVGQWVTLTLDQGDGRFYNSSQGVSGGHLNIRVSQRSMFAGGNVRFSASNSIVLVDDDYSHSCMNDIRYNSEWFPMDSSQNMESRSADVIRSDNLDDTCESNACMYITCIPPFKCIDMWRYAECGCPPGKIEEDGVCVNQNECLRRPCIQGACIDTEVGFRCNCFPGYEGELCGLARSESPFVDLSMGAILAIIICALVLLLVILLFIIFTRRRKPDSYTLGVDPNDDVRENIIHYNEEGVGEEDQDAYDINRLKKPMAESPPVRKSMPPPLYQNAKTCGPPQKAHSPASINDFVKDRVKESDKDPSQPPHDSVREYAYEGGGSDAGSLSSLASTNDPDDQEFDYLSNWGPRFNKLADMYGGHKH